MMTYKQQKGFTLIEMMIVIAIIAILAMVAIPSMIDMKRKFEVQREAKSFVATMNEARAEAIMKRVNIHVGATPSTGVGAGDITKSAWASKSDNVVWNSSNKPSATTTFNYMGRITNGLGSTGSTANTSQCVVLNHQSSADAVAVIMLYQHGAVQLLRNATACPS